MTTQYQEYKPTERGTSPPQLQPQFVLILKIINCFEKKGKKEYTPV